MKLSLIFLAFYVAILSCFPCQDMIADNGHDISANESQHRESDHKAEMGDFCSPFCICACCATATVLPIVFGLPAKSVTPFFAIQTFHYTPSFQQANASLIWQPPRLA